MQCNQCLKKLEEHDLNKSKTFAVAYGPCTEAMKNKLKTCSDHQDMSSNCNVIQLLDRIKRLMLGEDTEQDHYALMVKSMKQFISCAQGPKESIEGFFTRWNTQLEVFESKWGAFAPIKLQANVTSTDANKMRFQASVFLHSLDQSRYGIIIQELNNAFIRGNKKVHPETTLDVVTLASQWMGAGHRMKALFNS